MLQRKCYALFAKGHSILAIRQLNQDVRVRFAPSPTGNIHLGSLRTALYNYLFARKHGGKFLLRIEDTDQTRLVSKSVDQFYGLTVDEGPEVGGSYGPYVQSERLGLYQTESDRLIDSGHAYRCFCSEQRLEFLRKNAIRSNTIPKYDKKCRSISQKESLQRVANSEPFVVRFKMDRQDIDFKTLDESDMIILKSDGYPTYHMANIVDDSAMKISHVIRGMEWLSSTGKHALLYRAFDRPPPKFVHLPLITRDGKRKLSKRDKDSFVDYYSETLGALPIAVLNLMIRNGSGIVDFDPGRLYSLDEMAVSFDEKLIGKRNLQLDEDALRRLSRLAFQRTATAELVGVIRAKIAADVPSSRACLEDDYLVNIIEFLKSNEERFAYLSELTTGQFSWFLNKPTSAEKILTAFDRESTVKCLQELQSIDSWSNDSLKGVASNCAISFPKLLAVLRYALIDNVHVFTIDEQKKYNLHMEENMGLLSFFVVLTLLPAGNAAINKAALKEQAYNLFMHGYRSYMNHAYPADELMPLTCQGRFRGVTPSRGDVDDSLGNFSLTLVDTLDTLVVLGELDEFERAVKLVVDNVRFNSDLIVSVFETNIRVLGGLLSAHLMAELVRSKGPSRLAWYTDRQLLKMAIDIGDRLLPAFNTTSGIPYSRINLRHGMSEYLQRQKDTCTACGGTMLLEMAALSRLSGNPVYEQKARKAMDFLWSQRHRSSDLMGTVLNVHSGDWVRRESGIGAGIDSYYEYCLKSYILLGDHSYLERFNKHYDAVMRYVNKGPLFVDVHMHRPTVATRQFMDALLAFWPGLQVLKGDVKEAIEMHEMLFQVVKKHKFLPEAFTHDFQVHWGEHPLRPEFIESTYFLYRATRDEHYLEVAQQVMESIEKYVKVKCGFAAVKDVRVMTHEDRMDSFVLSETFKYLYMIFAEPEDLIFDPDNYVLTTEAHFLPLSMGVSDDSGVSRRVFIHPGDVSDPKKVFISANPVRPNQIPTAPDEANKIRTRTRNVLEELFVIQGQVAKEQCVKPSERLRAWAFSASNADHIRQLREMGIDIQFQEDGRMLLSHTTASGGVVRCAMDMDSSEATFYKDGLNTSTVHLNQMIQLLVLILVIWTAFIASALVLACSSTVLTRNSSSTEPSETKKDL